MVSQECVGRRASVRGSSQSPRGVVGMVPFLGLVGFSGSGRCPSVDARAWRKNTIVVRIAVSPALLCVVMLAGCGPKVKEQEEPVVLVEHRIAPCRTVCESWMDPECGNLSVPGFPVYESFDACVELCADEEAGWYWGRQDDGTDACVAEWDAYAACLSSLSCEENLAHWESPPTSDFPCKQEVTAQVRCGYDNLPPSEGGS